MVAPPRRHNPEKSTVSEQSLIDAILSSLLKWDTVTFDRHNIDSESDHITVTFKRLEGDVQHILSERVAMNCEVPPCEKDRIIPSDYYNLRTADTECPAP